MSARDLLNVYHLGRKCIYEFCRDLSEAHALWRPDPDAKPILEILMHLTDAERYWLYKLGYKVPDRPEPLSLDVTLAHLKEMDQLISDLIENANPAELIMFVETDRGELSLIWALKRLTHHMNYHLGTLVYLRSIVEPEWESDVGSVLWSKAVDAFSELVPNE